MSKNTDVTEVSAVTNKLQTAQNKIIKYLLPYDWFCVQSSRSIGMVCGFRFNLSREVQPSGVAQSQDRLKFLPHASYATVAV